jgi:Family of unknown function (DUF5330)
MFFLLRLAFWLSVVCILLPGNGDKSATSPLDTVQAVSAAGAAYSDMRGFCERQPDACVVGGQMAVALGQRAQDGAKTIVEFISHKMSEKSAPVQSASRKAAPGAQANSAGTLTPADLELRGTVANTVPLPPVSPRREAQNRRPSA